jgi:peptidoglycan/xylan/chitin deacetylase (PgdA/CDA1 family)
MNPLALAIAGKGPVALLRRAFVILWRYGLGRADMARALAQLIGVLRRFDCSATFPITAVALGRSSALIESIQAQGVEFAVHGYRHIDHSQLSQAEQLAHLAKARQIFAQAGIEAMGFRGPHLHWNTALFAALRQQGLVYDSSQAIAWDVTTGCETPAYRRALRFYGARAAGDYPSLPFLDDGLVHIPYSLPDDEALVERLALTTTDQMGELWLAILRRTYELGELFTLGLHPERAALCLEPLAAVLSQARSLAPPVWIARLDEIAAWWRARYGAAVEVADVGDSAFHLNVGGPNGTTVLARAVEVDVPTVPWLVGYRRVEAAAFTVRSPRRPFVGLAPGTPPRLADFLRQQGYVVEISGEGHRYACYFDQAEFAAEQERLLLAQIEGADQPLVRLGRWPNGARSALSVTGDIDALTLWDYGLRFLGR